MPPTFTAVVRSGSCMETGTEGMAARWNTYFAPATALFTTAGSATEPSTIRKRGFRERRAAVSRLPLEKSSSPATSWPFWSNSSARCPPMNPAAPVTQTFDIAPEPSPPPTIISPARTPT